jgi:hypothetical protein
LVHVEVAIVFMANQQFLNTPRWSGMQIESILWRIILFSVTCLSVCAVFFHIIS